MKRIDEFFDKEAAEYEKKILLESAGKRYVSEIEKKIIDRWFVKEKKVLDVGVGTGRFSKILISKGIKVTGLDISRKMLEEARKRIGRRVKLVYGNAENMKFKDAEFDGLVCMRVFKYFDNPERALSEFNRVCKRGALIVFEIANKNSYQGIFKFFSKIFRTKKLRYIDTIKLADFKKVKKSLDKNNIKIISIEKTIRIPYFIYGFVNNYFLLSVMKNFEKILDLFLGKVFLSRDIVLICKKD